MNTMTSQASAVPNSSETKVIPEIAELAALWNQLYGDIMYRITVPQPGDRLYHLLLERIREHGYPAVREAILRLERSRYLMGLKSMPPASLTWLMQQQNFAKFICGYYDDFSAKRKDRCRGLERDTDLDRIVLDRIIQRGQERSVSA